MFARKESGKDVELLDDSKGFKLNGLTYGGGTLAAWKANSAQELIDNEIEEITREKEPLFDAETEELKLIPVQVGASDTVERWSKIPLTAQYLDDRKADKLREGALGLADGLDGFVALLVAKGLISKSELDADFLKDVNAQLTLHGKPPL